MKLKVSALCLILIFIFTGSGLADQRSQAQGLFYQGNADYSEEKFEQAIADYEGTLTLGLESAALYYNLGNAYFKHGSLGKAILNYQRAQRLSPRDADIASNLDYAQSLIEGGEMLIKRGWFKRLFFGLAGRFNTDELCWFSTILYVILAVLIILVILVKRLRKPLVYIIYPIVVALIISAALFFVLFYQTAIQRQAVIIVGVSDAKFEPFTEATTYFNIYEGSTIFVTGVKEDWLKVRRLDGRQGWLKQSDLELL